MDKIEIQRRVTEKHGDKITYLGESVSVGLKQPFRCNVCEHVWASQLYNVYYTGSGCPKCNHSAGGRANTKTHDTYVNELFQMYGDEITVLEPYMRSRTPILHKCKNGHTLRKMPSEFLSGYGCVKCSYIKRSLKARMSTDEYKKRLAKENKFELLSAYVGSQTKSLHKCLTCKLEWLVVPTSLTQGQGCPRCALLNANPARFKLKNYLLNNRIVRVQGFEPFALDILQKEIDPNLIKIGMDVPKICYIFQNKNRIHHPDIFIAGKNLIIEVKSTRTLSVDDPNLFYMLCAKRNAAVEQGFNYEVWAFLSTGIKLILPDNWWKLSHDTFKDLLHEYNFAYRKRSRK